MTLPEYGVPSSWNPWHRSAYTGSGDDAAETTASGLESLFGQGHEKAAEANLNTDAVWEVRDQNESPSTDGSPSWSQASQQRASVPFILVSW